MDEAIWLALDRRPGETLRAGLERVLRESILARALRAGVRLPASRELARQLGVSRGVVSDAYGQLEAQGFLTSRAREAPAVANVQAPTFSRAEPELQAPAPRYDLSPTSPDVSLFPLTRWPAARSTARRTGAATLDYRDSRGERVLRAALADHLGRTRGVIADPAQILIVQGTAQSVDLLLRVLRARDAARIAVEDPSHTTQHQRIRAMGLEVVPRSLDAQGMLVDGLDADAVIVTPAHQFPTRKVLSGQRRRQLIAWSRATRGLIIEDDYDSEFRYDREPVRALQGIAPESVAYLGTVSKTLAPALRLGWMALPVDFVDDAQRTKRLVDDFSPALDQLTLAEFIVRGDYDRHIRRARGVYRVRRDRLLTACAAHLPDLRPEGVSAGMHVLLSFPPAVDDVAVAAAANLAGIRVPALTTFRIVPPGGGGLVVGYGRLHADDVEAAIQALAAVVRPHL